MGLITLGATPPSPVWPGDASAAYGPWPSIDYQLRRLLWNKEVAISGDVSNGLPRTQDPSTVNVDAEAADIMAAPASYCKMLQDNATIFGFPVDPVCGGNLATLATPYANQYRQFVSAYRASQAPPPNALDTNAPQTTPLNLTVPTNVLNAPTGIPAVNPGNIVSNIGPTSTLTQGAGADVATLTGAAPAAPSNMWIYAAAAVAALFIFGGGGNK